MVMIFHLLLLCGWFALLLIPTIISEIVLNGTFAITYNIEFVYQIPSVDRSQLKGVIFIAHGNPNHAASYWPKGPHCEICFGQPLSQYMVKSGLQRNYVILAGTALKAIGSFPMKRSWTTADYPRIVRLLHYFYDNILKIPPQQLPLHLWGVSNGGYHLGSFAQNITWRRALQPLTITSLTILIAPLKLDTSFSKSNKFPIPTHFVAMRKDGGISWEIHKILPLLESSQVTLADPEPITKDYFLQRGMGVFTESESEVLANLFKQQGLLDTQNYLSKDPISYNHIWRQMIRSNAPEIYSRDLKHYEHSALNQLLCSAFAYHGHPVQQYDKVFEFMEQAAKQRITK